MGEIQIPKLLSAGDIIGIVAPGRKLKSEILDQAVALVKSWGVNVVLGKNIYSDSHSYLSGSDHERFSDFQNMLDDPNVRCILCARGGYGSTRFVDQLDFKSVLEDPKWLVGFSDVTALHLRLFQEKIASVHGTMPVLFPKPESVESVESIRQVLFGGTSVIEAKPCHENRFGTTEGVAVGGNLSLIVESLGTKTEIETDDKILIIEEVDEYSYRLDRMLNQLHRAGKLKGLRGLVIGYMTDIKEGEIVFGESAKTIIKRVTQGTGYPIAFNFPTGHENPNFAWIHGGMAKLEVSPENAILSSNLTKLHN
jgi:muramoyltetrapeptide carboxypeptidase